ncbi:MAG: pyrroline-5-carboxylate reductase [Candidatus Omnitrophica bacterium]|nr:pyrroline-5-carboxylate reductase [Candidatus Omnitrophota bacterium]
MALTIGVLGCGNMGSAIAERLKERYRIFVFDKDSAKTSRCAGMTVTADLGQVFEAASTVVLAVKPQDFEKLLNEACGFVSSHLLVSIAAGISTGFIESRLGKGRVVRVMPNLAVTVGAGISCIAKGSRSTTIDVSFVQGLFNRLGKTLVIEERLMNQATAVSGSGPGFFFDLVRAKPQDQWDAFAKSEFMPALQDAGSKVGFGLANAKFLAEATTTGSLAVLKETHTSPDILRIRVASRGGTTEAGLKVLRGDIKNLDAAVLAAKQRADELSVR